MASVVAGVLWDAAGPAGTFLAGGAFCLLTLLAIAVGPRASRRSG